MKKGILTFIVVFLSLTHVVYAQTRVLVVQSRIIPPYERVVEGFSSTYHGKKSRLITSDMRASGIPEKIRAAAPDLILAVGQKALQV